MAEEDKVEREGNKGEGGDEVNKTTTIAFLKIFTRLPCSPALYSSSKTAVSGGAAPPPPASINGLAQATPLFPLLQASHHRGAGFSLVTYGWIDHGYHA